MLVQKRYVQDIMTSREEIMNDPNTLATAVNAIDAVHGKGFAVQPVARWALDRAYFDASVTHCADKLNAKYINGPDALGGAETFNFSNCEAYFLARLVWRPVVGVPPDSLRALGAEAKLLAVFVVDTNETELTIPFGN